jgi:hypothetical protein
MVLEQVRIMWPVSFIVLSSLHINYSTFTGGHRESFQQVSYTIHQKSLLRLHLRLH